MKILKYPYLSSLSDCFPWKQQKSTRPIFLPARWLSGLRQTNKHADSGNENQRFRKVINNKRPKYWNALTEAR